MRTKQTIYGDRGLVLIGTELFQTRLKSLENFSIIFKKVAFLTFIFAYKLMEMTFLLPTVVNYPWFCPTVVNYRSTFKT